MTRGLLVVAHGSRRAEANDLLQAVVDALAARGGWHDVRAGFLELASPSIAEGFAALVAAGCDEVVAHPYFLFPGNHTMADIPAQLAAAAASHPQVSWRVTAPLGFDERLLDVVAARVADSAP